MRPSTHPAAMQWQGLRLCGRSATSDLRPVALWAVAAEGSGLWSFGQRPLACPFLSLHPLFSLVYCCTMNLSILCLRMTC